jgi:hypothetical protein
VAGVNGVKAVFLVEKDSSFKPLRILYQMWPSGAPNPHPAHSGGSETTFPKEKPGSPLSANDLILFIFHNSQDFRPGMVERTCRAN